VPEEKGRLAGRGLNLVILLLFGKVTDGISQDLAVTELGWLVLSYIGCYRVGLAGTELYWLVPSYFGWY
jgi:hypothetical protein